MLRHEKSLQRGTSPSRRTNRRLSGGHAIMFPGGHGGFLGDEYDQPGAPEAFASTLREVLAAQA